MKSILAKYPVIVFGVIPTIALVVSIVAATVLLGASLGLFNGKPHPVMPVWAAALGQGWAFSTTYLFPLLIGALVAMVGIRQRVKQSWVLAGVAIICFVGGFHTMILTLPAYPGGPGEIEVSLGLIPPFPDFQTGLGRAVMNIFLISLPAWWALNRRPIEV